MIGGDGSSETCHATLLIMELQQIEMIKHPFISFLRYLDDINAIKLCTKKPSIDIITHIIIATQNK